MYDLITLARPYAKAIFKFAIEHKAIAQWQKMLEFAVEVGRNEKIAKMLSSAISHKKIANIFITICGDELNYFGKNLIQVMAENNRLTILPYVLEQFVLLRAMQESIVEVEVITFSTLKKEQLIKICTAMEKRLSLKIKVKCKVDKSIIAGIIIRTRNLVIDGSIRGRLNRFTNILQY